MNVTKIDELNIDLAELKSLESQATRKRVQDLLSIEIRKIATEITLLKDIEKSNNQSENSPAKSTGAITKNSEQKRYLIELTNYAWDQSDKYVKLFITLNNAQNIKDPKNVTTDFANNSILLNVKDLNQHDYTFKMKNLLNPINVEKSYHKVKNDLIAIYLKKVEEGDTWSHITTTEKRVSDIKEAATDNKNTDMQDNIMGMLQKMYNTSDTETKRMIEKTWQKGL